MMITEQLATLPVNIVLHVRHNSSVVCALPQFSVAAKMQRDGLLCCIEQKVKHLVQLV